MCCSTYRFPEPDAPTGNQSAARNIHATQALVITCGSSYTKERRASSAKPGCARGGFIQSGSCHVVARLQLAVQRDLLGAYHPSLACSSPG